MNIIHIFLQKKLTKTCLNNLLQSKYINRVVPCEMYKMPKAILVNISNPGDDTPSVYPNMYDIKYGLIPIIN